MLQLLTRILEEELAVDHEEESKEVEKQQNDITNDDILMRRKNVMAVRCQKAKSFQQDKSNHEEEHNSNDGDVGDHGWKLMNYLVVSD